MNAVGYILVFVGLVIFLVGYWFLAESQGTVQCTDTTIVAKSSTNKVGGIAGIVIGIVIMILGIVFGHSSEPMPE